MGTAEIFNFFLARFVVLTKLPGIKFVRFQKHAHDSAQLSV